MSEIAKTLGRRLFARAAMGVPTAIKFASHSPPPRGTMACGSLATSAAVGMPAAELARAEVRDKIYKAFRSGQAKLETERESIRDMRRSMMGGLDPDLAVLNSMSLARRVSIQIDREIATRERHRGLRASIVRMFGGNPEDYE